MILALLLACASSAGDTDPTPLEGEAVLVHDFTDLVTVSPDGFVQNTPCPVPEEGGHDYAPCCPFEWTFVGVSYDGVVCALVSP